MTRTEKRTLFSALAFVTFVLKNDDIGETAAGRIRQLAGLIESFCETQAPNMAKTLALVNDPEAEVIDQRIKGHLDELRGHEITRLPQDRETLLKFFDRLQHRKTRRVQRDFYASVSEEELGDMVLRFLDDELLQNSEVN